MEDEDRFLVEQAQHIVAKPDVGSASSIVICGIIDYNSNQTDESKRVTFSEREATVS